MIEYKDDDWLANLPQLKQIIGEHYEELSVTKEYPLDPAWDKYENLWNQKALKFVTVKDDGKLIGYIIYFITPHLHYQTCITATEDIYFSSWEFAWGGSSLSGLS